MAGAVRFMDETTGPPLATNNAALLEVRGPEATEPEHTANFVGPLPEYMQTPAGRLCPSCSGAVRARQRNELRPPLPQPPQR